MDFLKKLDNLMEANGLNKSSLSRACNIPYTTIDGWYKKGYEGLKLTTLRKLAEFFGTTLDFWAIEDKEQNKPTAAAGNELNSNEIAVALAYRQASEDDKAVIDAVLKKYACPQNAFTKKAI